MANKNPLHAAIVESLLKKAQEKEAPTEPERPSNQDPKQIEELVKQLKAQTAAKRVK
ncbi:MAG: hypothetical protein QW625_00265 [Candidatus Nanoarchaeia archaeon]